MEVSFIIANYNGKDVIEQCIRSILMQNYPREKYEIIVADNNSPDESWKLVKKFRGVKLIRNKENYGFVRSNNIAVKASSGEFLVFMNNDASLIGKNWLTKMVSRIKEDKNIGGIGCKILYPSGKTWYGGGKIYFPGFAKHLDLKKESYVDYLGLAAGIIRRSTGEIYFDEKFIMYAEDADICKRIRMKGYKLLYYPEVTAYHHISNSRISKNEEYYSNRNIGYYYTKYYSSPLKILYFLADVAIFFQIRVLYRLIRNPKRIIFWKEILKARFSSIKLMLQ